MRCSNCGSELQAGSRFCTGCGAATGPGPVLSTAPDATHMADAPSIVASSSLVYLFGDRFVERDTAFTAGEKLPCSEIKVKKKDLVQTMFQAAFAALARDDRFHLTLGQRKTLLFKTNAVFVSPGSPDLADPGALEAALLHALTGSSQRDSVEDLVWRCIRETTADPWGQVIGQVQDYLLRLGYFVEGERSGVAKLLAGRKLVPQCERIGALEPALPAVQALLESVRCQDSVLHKQLCEDIKKGINSRYEAPQQDSDV
jgi:hypothetical protein